VAPPATPTLTGVRLNATTIRLTVANAAGTTVTPYYATAAEVAAGTAPTAGTPRSGNGIMDITVVEGVNYFCHAVAATTEYSLPSPVIGPLSTGLASGTARTLNLGFPRLLAQPKVKVDNMEETIIAFEYELGSLTLAGANLENGDWLPANTLYGIVASTWEIISVREKKAAGSNANLAVGTARAMRAWEDSGP
jgi:hypothetical protein